jgi:serine/threonine protein kinase
MAAKDVSTIFQGLRKQFAQAVGRTSENEGDFLDGYALSGTLLFTEKGEYVLKCVGESAYSQTFIAEPVSSTEQDQVLARVAIKRMHPRWKNKRPIREHFRQEIEIVGDFLHPQLPRLQFKGELASLPYYAYDYIDGVPLTHLLKKRELYPPELVSALAPDLIMKILQQLRYLHEQMNCVVHGYIGLRSLLLTPQHEVSLIDFGCAYRKDRVIENDYRWVIDPRYCSPEQARQEAWDESSDLYQLGVVFYELLSAKAWNAGATPEEQVVFSSELKPMEQDFLVQHTSVQISALIADLLHPYASVRPSSASVCLQRLSAAIEGAE